MNVHRTKMRLKSLLSGLLCLGVLLSQTPMVFAAGSADEPGISAVVEETQQAEASVEGVTADEQAEASVEGVTADEQAEASVASVTAGEPAEASEEDVTAGEPAAEESYTVALLSLTLEDGEVEITSAQDLADLAAAVNAGTEGYDTVTVILKQDIDLSTLYTGDSAITTWTPIGSADHPFTGEFDGGNHTVSGLTITAPTVGNQALFGVVSGKAEIYNLTVEGSVTVVAPNSSSTTLNNNAGVIGSIDANATGVVVENVTSKVTVNGGRSVGGIVGLIDTGAVATLTDCANAGSVTATPGTTYGKSTGVGGIAGAVLSEDAEITGCENTGAVANGSATILVQGTGGIVGYISGGTVDGCDNTGTVTGSNNYYLGGIAGYVTEYSTINDCTNGSPDDTTAGAVTSGRIEGGIAGYSVSGAISQCINYGAVSLTSASGNLYGVGGIAGRNDTNGTVSGCINYGTVTITYNGTISDNIGGIVAYTTGAITGCTNHGAVTVTGNATAASGAGGVVGKVGSGAQVYNSSNSGAVAVTDTSTGTSRHTGGVVGYILAGGEVRFCGNEGAVSRGPATAGAATSNTVAGVAGYVAGTLRNSWSTGTVTYSGTKAVTASAGVAGIFGGMSSGTVRDCYASGKIILTGEGLTADTTYAYAIGPQYGSSGCVENCVYYCADYTAPETTDETAAETVNELQYIQPMAINSSSCVSACFVRLGDTYTRADDTTVTLTAADFSSPDGVLKVLNDTKVWELKTDAAYPTLISYEAWQNLVYTVAPIHLEMDTASEFNSKLQAVLTLNGANVSIPYETAKMGDQFQLTINVPANVENALLMVSANETTLLSEPKVENGANTVDYTYTITVGDTDADIRYVLTDTSKDDTAWYVVNPDASEFTITRAGELAFLSQLTAGTATNCVGSPLAADSFSGKTIHLGADVDLSSVCHPANAEQGIEEVSWTPITGFTGTFDGGVYTESADEDGNVTKTLTGRHTIKNLYVNSTAANAGLFGYATLSFKAVVNNLIMENATVVTTGNCAAAIIGEQGVAANCTVKNSTIQGADYVGAVVSGSISSSISNAYNCTVENCTVEGANYVGGVIGAYYASNSNLTGNMAVNTTVFATGDYAGGIAGRAVGASGGMYGSDGSISMNQVLGGSVTGGNYVGGVAGMLGKQGLTSSGLGGVNGGSCSGSIVTATVKGSGDYVGGIAGYGGVTFAIYYNYNAETGLGISTTDETALNVGPISGLPRVTNGDGPNASTSIATLNSCLYLSNVNSEDESGAVSLTAESFTLDETLYLLQGSSIFWELKEGAQYPTFSDTETPTLYKLTVQPLSMVSGGNSLAITPLAEDSEGYPYRLYGTEGGVQWTYATQDTVIPLTVAIADGWSVTFYPADAVTITPAVGENGTTTYAVTLTDDVTLEYQYSKAISPDTSWYNSEDPQTGYTIANEAQLRGLAQMVNAGNSFAGVTLTLTDDLTLEGGTWTPIGDSAGHPFAGTFNGNGKTISDLYIYQYSATDYAGLFGYLAAGGQISGLTVNGSVSADSKYTGGVVAWSEGALTDITSGVSVSKFGDGSNYTTTLAGYAGGIVAYQTNTASLDGALFTGTVTVSPDPYDMNSTSTGSSYIYAGGLAAYNAGLIANGENRGQLSNVNYSLYYVGGVVGYNMGIVNDSRNTANLSGITTEYLGGIAAYTGDGSVIARSGNDGDLTAPAESMGGVAGGAAASVISQTYNRGSITCTVQKDGADIGGVVGKLYVASATATGNILSYSYNTGSVAFTGTQNTYTSYIYVGGLVGSSMGNTNLTTSYGVANRITNCYTTVTGSTEGATLSSSGYYTGSLKAIGTATVGNCYVLDSTASSSGITALSSEDLQNAASQLGITFTSDLADDESINGGYPVLHWEVDDPSKGVTLNFHNSDLYTLNENAGISPASRYEPDIIVVLSPEEATAEIEKEVTVPEGFVYYGWYADKTDENTKYDPDTTVLTAGDSYERYWDLVKIAVTLDFGYQNEDGTQVTETVLVPENALMAKPANPEYEGHDFVGWFTKVPGVGGYVFAENSFDFSSTPISENIILYAKWQELTADLDWYSEESSSFTITTVPQLFGLLRLVNSGTNFAGKTVTLGADLDLTGFEFHAIGTDPSHAFSGTFDGANYTISNLTIKQPFENYQALFGYTVGGEIKDLTVLGSVTGKQYVAGILAYGTDTALSNLTFGAAGVDSTVTSTYSNTGALNTCNQAGGVVGTLAVNNDTTLTGLVNYGTVSGSDVGGVLYTVDFGAFVVNLTLKDCANYGSVNAANRAGGVAAYLFDNVYAHKIVFDGCVNAGEVKSAATATYYAGGILGYGDTGAATTTDRIVFTFNECVNRGSVAAPGAGGIVGYLTQSGATEESHASFVKCENAGSVISVGLGGGGIIGRVFSSGYISLTDCINTGNPTGTSNVAGMVGYLYSSTYAAMTNCVNESAVTGTSYLAGMVGYLNSSAYATLTNCVNNGNNSGTNYVAGMMGYLYNSGYATLTDCINTGDLTGTSYLAGMVGYLGSSTYSALTNCVNKGNITGTSYLAGIVADLYSSTYPTLTDCVNEGAVTGTANYEAGIVAYLYSSTYADLTSCVNKGEIHGGSYVAGIVGYCRNSAGAGAVLTGCANRGDVTASGTYAAGILTDAYRGPATLNACYNAGSVTNTGTGCAAGLVLGYSSSYKTALNSCFNYGTVSAAAAGSAYSVGQNVTAVSAYTLENGTYQYALSEDGTVALTPMTDADTVTVAKTADEFRDGTILKALNEYFTSQDPAQDAIWYQGANYPVLALVYYTTAINSGHAAVTIEGLTANGDGSYSVLEDAQVRFTVTPNAGYSVSSVAVNGEPVTAGEDGAYTLIMTGDVIITVTVKRTSWNTQTEVSADVDAIIASVAAGTNEKPEDSEAETDYDDTLDYNDDGLNDLLDILNILYYQKYSTPAEEVPTEETPAVDAGTNTENQ